MTRRGRLGSLIALAAVVAAALLALAVLFGGPTEPVPTDAVDRQQTADDANPDEAVDAVLPEVAALDPENDSAAPSDPHPIAREQRGHDVLVLDARDGAPVPGIEIEFTIDPFPENPNARDPTRILERATTDENGIATGASGRPWFYARAAVDMPDGARLRGQVRVYTTPSNDDTPGAATTLWLHEIEPPLNIRVVDATDGTPIPGVGVSWRAVWPDRPDPHSRRTGTIHDPDRTDERGVLPWFGYGKTLRSWRAGHPLLPDSPPLPSELVFSIADLSRVGAGLLELESLPDPGDTIELRVARRGSIDVRVFGPDGQPLRGSFEVSARAGSQEGRFDRIGALVPLREGRALVPFLPLDGGATLSDDDLSWSLVLADAGGRPFARTPITPPHPTRPRIEITWDLRPLGLRWMHLHLVDENDAPLALFDVEVLPAGPENQEGPFDELDVTPSAWILRTDEQGVLAVFTDRPTGVELRPTGAFEALAATERFRISGEQTERAGTSGVLDLGTWRLPIPAGH